VSANGYLTDAELSPIVGGTQLANGAAAAWNAMAHYIHDRTGTWIQINGPDSGYRSYARQVYWRNYWCGRGACQNAAVPGTSNHGWGLAVDVPPYVRSLIDQYGHQFGWAKEWSDASWEPWHLKYRAGVWNGSDPGGGSTENRYPVLKKGDKGDAVKRMQKHLHRWNVGVTRPKADGSFGENTADAVREFQLIHHLGSDGVVGGKTWRVLRHKDKLYNDEREHVNRARLLMAGDNITDKEREQIRGHREWAAKRAHSIKDTADDHGWNHEDREFRFKTLKALAGDRY